MDYQLNKKATTAGSLGWVYGENKIYLSILGIKKLCMLPYTVQKPFKLIGFWVYTIYITGGKMKRFALLSGVKLPKLGFKKKSHQ